MSDLDKVLLRSQPLSPAETGPGVSCNQINIFFSLLRLLGLPPLQTQLLSKALPVVRSPSWILTIKAIKRISN